LVDRDYLKYISKHLNQIHIPKEKFTVYNPGKKIAIVSLYTSEIADYAICSEMSVRDYCLANGYTFYVYREKLQADASANWSKARAILNHFDDHEDIVWMDSDTIIYNPQKRFEDILARCTGTKKIIACEDIGANNKKIAKGMMLNSGVVIFRNHNYTKNIIKKWMNADCDKSSLYASGGDQGILCDVLKKSDGFGFNRKIFPMNEFNTDPRFVDESTFILHFMAYPYELKKIFMRYFVSD
jgi:lipopolysaccharide biosynthesis glycosyltransferase